MLRRCQIEVKYAEGDADSVKSDTGGIISATRVAQTLHGDTAKHPRRTFKDGLTLSDWWLLSPITRSSITLDQFCFLIMVDYCV